MSMRATPPWKQTTSTVSSRDQLKGRGFGVCESSHEGLVYDSDRRCRLGSTSRRSWRDCPLSGQLNWRTELPLTDIQSDAAAPPQWSAHMLPEVALVLVAAQFQAFEVAARDDTLDLAALDQGHVPKA